MLNKWIIALIFISHFGFSKTLPSWVLNPIKDSPSSFFTSGSGKSIEEAQADALNSLAMRLIVNVESETQSHSQLSDGQLKQRLNQSSIQVAEKMTFVDTKIVNSYADEHGAHVLVTVNKPSVFRQLVTDIQQNLLPLTVVKGRSTAQIIESRLNFDAIVPQYYKYIALLRAYSQDVTNLQPPIDRYLTITNELFATISYKVLTAGKDPMGLVNTMSTRLAAKGFTQAEKLQQLTVTLVGPELLYTVQSDHHAYKANGTVYFALNDEVFLQKKIDAFSFDKDKSLAWSSLSEQINRMIPE